MSWTVFSHSFHHSYFYRAWSLALSQCFWKWQNNDYMLRLSLNIQSALTGQLIHTWASTANNDRASVLKWFVCARTWWHVRSQCHRIKDWTTDETFQALQEQCFLLKTGVSRSFTWRTYIKYRSKGIKWEKKHNRSPLKYRKYIQKW